MGTTSTFIKFRLHSSLAPTVAAVNVVKATLKLYLSPFTRRMDDDEPYAIHHRPSGAIDIYPVTSAWSESTLNPSSPPTLAATAFATGIPLGQANSFLVIDLTPLVKQWLSGFTK